MGLRRQALSRGQRLSTRRALTLAQGNRHNPAPSPFRRTQQTPMARKPSAKGTARKRQSYGSAAGEPVKAAPEADRRLPFLHPRHTTQIHGHGPLLGELTAQFDAGALHHALLLHGPNGVGKATLAYRLARHVLAANEDPDRTARLIAAGSHPGLFIMRRAWDDKRGRHAGSIGVDDVRSLKGFLMHSAEANAWRVIVVDAVDEMTISAANALLKSLEEPPARCLFVLVCHNRGRLLATIRSRCRAVHVAPINLDDLQAAVTAAVAGVDDATAHKKLSTAIERADVWPQLMGLSGGATGRALAALSGDLLVRANRVVSIVQGLPRTDWASVSQLADGLPHLGSDPAVGETLELVRRAVSKNIRARLRDANDAGVPGRMASVMHQSLADEAEVAALNLNPRSYFIELFQALTQAAQAR